MLRVCLVSQFVKSLFTALLLSTVFHLSESQLAHYYASFSKVSMVEMEVTVDKV